MGEKERYARHLILEEIGEPGQEKLKRAKVLVVGAGGLGSPVLLYLTAAGIGRIGILDNDIVSESNLQRQILYDTQCLGAEGRSRCPEASGFKSLYNYCTLRSAADFGKHFYHR